MSSNTDYDAIQQKIHNGEIVMKDGRKYEELSDDEKAELDQHFDDLKAKQAEEKEAEEKEKEYQEGLEKFKADAHENIKTGSGKSYDELTDAEKKKFDEAVEDYYAERMGRKNDNSDSTDEEDGTDSEPDTDMSRGREMSKNKSRDDEEYVR